MSPGGMAMAAAAALLAVALAGCAAGPVAVGDDGCPVRDVAVVRELAVANMAGQGRMGPAASQEFHVVPAPEWPAEARWSCVRAVSATIAWDNGATAGADLFVGLEDPEAGVSAVGQDRQQLPGDGAHVEEVVAPVHGDPAALEDGLRLVVYSDWASLSAGGLPVTATLVLHVARDL